MFRSIAVLAAALCLLTTSANAQETNHAALRDRSLKVLEGQFLAFREAADQLAFAAQQHCAGDLPHDVYLDAFKSTWLAWAPLDAYQFGPIEQRGAVLTIGFWPDKKGFVARGLKTLLTQPAESLNNPAVVAAHSVAAQGLPAIERLLFSDLPACPAIVGISAHIRDMAQLLFDDWFAQGGWADLARSAGPDNPVYLTDAEFTKVLYTAIDFELTRIADARLGRPLGTFDSPKPKRAEAWRSGLSLDIIDAQLAGIATLLEYGFAGDVFNPSRHWVLGVIQDTRNRIPEIGAPLDQAVSHPTTRIRVEGLQTQVRYLLLQFDEDIGPGLGVETGFSAGDGD
jgi:predicted lipoprotein